MKPPPPRFNADEANQGREGEAKGEEGGPGPPPGPSAAGAAAGSLMPPPPRPTTDELDTRKRAAKAAAAAAAAAAVTGVTPAQRDRAVAEAVAAYTAEVAAPPPQEGAPAYETEGSGDGKDELVLSTSRDPPAATYEPPDWGGPPEGIPYALEVLKSGQVVGTLDISVQNHYTFGRSHGNHVVLEHPSASRLHAVLQFELGSGNMFLYDNSSTHGTFLNKRRIKSKVYAPVRVGDVIKFGQSTRLYIVQGPPELMPEEGPSKQQRQEMMVLAAQADRKERDAQIAKAQMSQALAKSGVGSNSQGATWGLLGEDAEEEEEDVGGQPLDWRIHAETKGLTDKQQKTADKIRKYEWKLKNLQTEAERIRAKESGPDGLTLGQATQLSRNEQAIEKISEEMEDLEEVLVESIRGSLRDKADAARREAEGTEGKKKRKKRQEMSDDEEGSGEDDDFYDRTAKGGKKAKFGKVKMARQKAVTVDELFGRKEALIAEVKRLREAVAIEESSVGSHGSGPGGTATQDPLDEFMNGVETSMEEDKINRLRRELAEAEAQQAQTEKLLKIADPDGWFRPDSKAAVEAKARAASEMLLARHRKAAEDAARRTAKIKEADAAPFVPEEDDDEEEKRGGQGGDTERRGGQLGADSVPGGEAAVGDTKPDLAGMSGAGVARQPTERSAEETGEGRGNDSSRQPSSSSAKGYLGGANTTQDQQKSKMKPGRASARGIGGLLARGDLSMPATSTVRVAGGNAKKATDLHSRAAASVADKLAVLSRLKNRGGAGSIEEEEGGGMMDWKPPEGQTGDGRTALNDQLGY